MFNSTPFHESAVKRVSSIDPSTNEVDDVNRVARDQFANVTSPQVSSIVDPAFASISLPIHTDTAACTR